MHPPASLSLHDRPEAADLAVIDAGLDRFNEAAAPLHEVRPLACFARDAQGGVIGGAVGRRWGAVGELQQLWLPEALRGRGWGRALVLAFEAALVERGCTELWLETFSFQAPGFYRRLGYEDRLARPFPHGIVKHHFVKRLAPQPDR